GARDQHLRRSATVARLPDHRADGDGVLQLREVSAFARLPADDDRTWHHGASHAGEREEPSFTVGDGLWTRADVLLRAARIRGARGRCGIGARVPQASAVAAALVLYDDTAQFRVSALGGLCGLDCDNHRALSAVPLVC